MTAWAVLDLAASAIALAALVTLHLLPTGLPPLQHAVSEYGISRYRAGYRALTVALGVAGVAAAALTAAAGARRAVVVLLALFAASRLAISWVPMDPRGTRRTPRGTGHLVLAFVAFVSAAAAAGRLHGDGIAFSVATALFIAGFIGMLAARPWFGAAERLVYAGTFVLLVSAAVVFG